MLVCVNQKASALQLNSFSLSLRSSARISNSTFRFLLLQNALPFEKESEPFKLAASFGVQRLQKRRKENPFLFFFFFF